MDVIPALGQLATVGMSHRFSVIIDNFAYNLGHWSKVSGLTVSWQQLDYRVGEYGNRVWIYPGPTKYEPIVLTRAAGAHSMVVQHWLAQTSNHPQPLSGIIQLQNHLGIPIVWWKMNEFFPIAWSVETFDAGGGKPAIETLKLAHSGFLDDEMNSALPSDSISMY